MQLSELDPKFAESVAQIFDDSAKNDHAIRRVAWVIIGFGALASVLAMLGFVAAIWLGVAWLWKMVLAA